MRSGVNRTEFKSNQECRPRRSKRFVFVVLHGQGRTTCSLTLLHEVEPATKFQDSSLQGVKHRLERAPKVIPIVIPTCYSLDMTQKVGPKGQVVIPKPIRDQLGFGPGDEVIVTITENGALIQPLASTRSLKGVFAGSKMLKALEQERRDEVR